MTQIEVGDKVSFRLCDSRFDSTGTVIDVTTYGGTGVYDPVRRALDIRDDRPSGWVHRMYEHEVKKIDPPVERPAQEWDGATF